MTWNETTIRELERESIRDFVTHAFSRGKISGRVLDYGCGRMPYKDIIEAAGCEYLPYDRLDYPASCAEEDHGRGTDPGPYDAILCTQVLQYVPYPILTLRVLYELLKPDGALVLTWATSWDEIETEDLWRFTAMGMERLLDTSGFSSFTTKTRAHIELGHFRFYLGHGAVAWK